MSDLHLLLVVLAIVHCAGCGAFWRATKALESFCPAWFLAGFIWPLFLPFVIGYWVWDYFSPPGH